MARLFSTGWELNSLTADMEFTTSTGTAHSIQGTTVRSGSYALRCNASSSQGYVRYTLPQITSGSYYARVYLRVAAAPSANTWIFDLTDAAEANGCGIRLNTDRTLNFIDVAGNPIGSASSALTLDTWYRVEITGNFDTNSGSARLDGSQFASGSPLFDCVRVTVGIGVNGSITSGDIYFDDLAVNSDSGSFQNSWPGAGSITVLRPNAAGDNTTWTPSAGSNYAAVDEVTPDDASTYVGSNSAGQIDDYDIDNPGGTVGTPINVVMVGVRYAGAGASANATFNARIKASSGGTVESSSNITPSNTTYVTNANSTPRTYPLILYDLPGASTTAWTGSDLTSTQIGLNLGTASTNAARVSAEWLLVEYTPQSAVEVTLSNKRGVKIIG